MYVDFILLLNKMVNNLEDDLLDSWKKQISKWNQIRQEVNNKVAGDLSKERVLPKESLFWNREAILGDLKDNYVKVEDGVEMMWYKWKKVYINLPAVWNFEWFKFDCFVWVGSETKSFLEKDHQDVIDNSYSIKDISNLLRAMNRYMKEYGVETDWDADYETALRLGNGWNCETNCKAWDCLKYLFPWHKSPYYEDRYWLKDVEEDIESRVEEDIDSRFVWKFHSDACFFDRRWKWRDWGRILLKLHD